MNWRGAVAGCRFDRLKALSLSRGCQPGVCPRSCVHRHTPRQRQQGGDVCERRDGGRREGGFDLSEGHWLRTTLNTQHSTFNTQPRHMAGLFTVGLILRSLLRLGWNLWERACTRLSRPSAVARALWPDKRSLPQKPDKSCLDQMPRGLPRGSLLPLGSGETPRQGLWNPKAWRVASPSAFAGPSAERRGLIDRCCFWNCRPVAVFKNTSKRSAVAWSENPAYHISSQGAYFDVCREDRALCCLNRWRKSLVSPV